MSLFGIPLFIPIEYYFTFYTDNLMLYFPNVTMDIHYLVYFVLNGLLLGVYVFLLSLCWKVFTRVVRWFSNVI
ncbi:MAG: hypothetical protein PHU05_02280 [Bacilli bacterium]|nr:hypothetical protein [Bacilli bacterium]